MGKAVRRVKSEEGRVKSERRGRGGLTVSVRWANKFGKIGGLCKVADCDVRRSKRVFGVANGDFLGQFRGRICEFEG